MRKKEKNTSETYESIFGHWEDSLDEGSARRKATTYTEKRGHTSMPRARFKPVFRWLKTGSALDRAAIRTGTIYFINENFEEILKEAIIRTF
jgi:hypothetical protein